MSVFATDKTITLNYSSFGLTTSYATKTATVDEVNFTVDQGYKGPNNVIQMNSSKGPGILYNSTPIRGLKSITVNVSSGNKTYTITTGTTEKPTTNSQTGTTGGTYNAASGDTYFQLKVSGASYFSSIVITYQDGSTSNLALINSPISLNFDLYPNSSSQTISYTTSSTGEISVSSNEYVTTTVNNTNKTITVTPIKVTPSEQTITVSQAADNTYLAGSATFKVSVVNSDPNAPGTQNNPYTVAQAIANTPSSGNVYIRGIVSSFQGDNIMDDYNSYRYYISDNGGTTTQLLVYKGKKSSTDDFTSADDLLIGDEVVIYGQLTTYSNSPQITEGNYIVTHNRPTFSITLGTMENCDEVFVFDDPEGNFVDLSTATFARGTTIYLSPDIAEGYVVEQIIVTDANNNNINVSSYGGGMWTFNMPGSNVTVSINAILKPAKAAEPVVGGAFIKVSSIDELECGYYLIAYSSGNVAFDGGLETLDVAENVIPITITNNAISANEDNITSYFYWDKYDNTLQSASGLYIGRTATSNGLDASETVAHTNRITFKDENAVITSSGNTTLRYNSASNQNRFRYYGSGQQAIQLYKYVAPETATVTSAGWATYITKHAVQFAEGDAYVVTNLSNDGATTIQGVTSVPANTPVLLKSAGEKVASILASAPTAPTTNLLKIARAGTTIPAGCYVLSYTDAEGVGFYRWTGTAALTQDRVYLQPAEGFTPNFIGINPGGKNSIENVSNSSIENNVYDLQGRRVAQPQKGLYIVNGKKVIIK